MFRRNRFLSAIAALFILGAPIAAQADPVHLDLTASTVSERNNNNLAKISTTGASVYTHAGETTFFAAVGESSINRGPSSTLGGARYHTPVYDLGFTSNLNTFTSVTASYGRAIDDGVLTRSQPKTIRSLTISGAVHVF